MCRKRHNPHLDLYPIALNVLSGPFLLIGWALPLQISGAAVDEGELWGEQGLVGVPSSARNQHPTSEGAEGGWEGSVELV